MAQVAWAPEADAKLESLDEAAPGAVELILSATQALQAHPRIGRPVEEGLRELVISRGATGYVALYWFDDSTDLVVILALRHQRESGYPEGELE